MKLTELEQVVNLQKERLQTVSGMSRDILPSVATPLEGMATVISGIRRCGKSTLMAQVASGLSQPFIYVNFDTPKLNSFGAGDFELIDTLARNQGVKNLFFDEIQLVHGWESYVRSALDAGFHVMVTGSNATMLSRELGTRLTGRHITKELFPFSYSEYCRFRSVEPSEQALVSFLEEGGFPQSLSLRSSDVLETLLDDILYRDIAVRYAVRDVAALRSLLYYLITNAGNLASAGKLTDIVHVKTPKTVLEYFSYFTQSYIVSFVPKFAYSYKAQMRNPKKVYCVDNGLQAAVSASPSIDMGRRLENMVYGELRRIHSQIFYFNEGSGECDFVVCSKNTPVAAYQVCLYLDRDNEQREVEGLMSAMRSLNITEGRILTLSQSDTILKDGMRIEVVPVWKKFA